MKLYIILLFPLILSQLFCSNFDQGLPSERPNIILIMADDMGFSDLGCYGSEISTPNIDALADEGIRFTQFYNAGRCCPTRASLLTGLYPHQTGVGHMTRDYGLPAYRGDLNNSCVTIAEVLKSEGYRTGISGKWHLTKHTGYWDGSEYTSKHNWPLQRGFEKFYGFIHGSSSYFDPILVKDNDPIEVTDENFYLTDAITDNAIDFIKDWQNEKSPFFLYVSYNAPHWPMHALPDDIEKYADTYRKGWEVIRKNRYQRMVEIGVIDPEWELSPLDPENEPWENTDHKEWQIRRMAVYAAMIDRMDQGVGRIIKTLSDKNSSENTLILFLADNGGSPEPIKNPRKFYVPRVTRSGEKVQLGTNPAVMPGPATTFQSYGLSWANASNSPFRLFKRWVHEGGISTPLIVRWPDVIDKKGSITKQTGHIIDIMATCLDAADVKYPDNFNGNKIIPLEGKSLIPVMRNEQRNGHEEIYWEHEGNRAIRKGNMKLVSYYSENRQNKVSRGKRTGAWELYDLENDRTELHNLAEERPELVDELKSLHQEWSNRVGVIPWEEIQEINTKLLQNENKK
jgi:arylsulfatase A-like enzyme